MVSVATTIAHAQSTEAPKYQQESSPVYDQSGAKVVGAIIVDRLSKTGAVVALQYTGPPRLVVDQAELWTHWHKYPQLTEVHISQTSINQDFAKYLATLTSLESVLIEGCTFSENALAPLRTMKELKTLEIYLSNGHPIHDWGFLSGMTHLESLVVIGDSVPPGFSKNFDSLTNLQHIEISVDDASAPEVIPALLNLKSVKNIELGRLR